MRQDEVDSSNMIPDVENYLNIVGVLRRCLGGWVEAVDALEGLCSSFPKGEALPHMRALLGMMIASYRDAADLTEKTEKAGMCMCEACVLEREAAIGDLTSGGEGDQP